MELIGGEFDASSIVTPIEVRGDHQPRLGPGGADEPEDLLVAVMQVE